MANPTLQEKIQAATLPAAPYAHWALRTAMAAIFVFHGLEKLSGGTPPQGMLDAMFFGSSAIFWLVGITETLAGVGIVAGGLKFGAADLVTRLAGAAFAVIMLTAAFTVHLPAWHFMQGGAEFQIMLAALGAFFAIRGNA